jgi:predicted permease
MADADYFKLMGIAVVAGRGFESSDTIDSTSTPVVILNESAARKLFPSTTPIGHRVTLGGPGPWITVIGVVRDVHDASLRTAPRAQVFMSPTQAPPSTTSLVVRFDGPVGPLVTEIRRIVSSIDKSVPMFDVETIGDVLDRASMADRFTMTLLSAFAFLALLLAAVGTYGVVAAGVAERRREIGVRMALGARAQDVLAMVLREGAWLFAMALPIALAGVWATARAMSSLLFGVAPTDVPTLAAATLALAAATGVACYVPARRAARVDPTTAIRGVDG